MKTERRKVERSEPRAPGRDGDERARERERREGWAGGRSPGGGRSSGPGGGRTVVDPRCSRRLSPRTNKSLSRWLIKERDPFADAIKSASLAARRLHHAGCAPPVVSTSIRGGARGGSMWRDRTIREVVWRGVDALRALASRDAPRATRPARARATSCPPTVRNGSCGGSSRRGAPRPLPTLDAAPPATTFSARGAHSRARPVERAIAPALRNHPWRMDVAAVLHQRPWKRVPVPSLISSVTTTHLAPHVVDGVECPLDDRSRGDAVAYEAEYAHLRRLCEHFIVSPPPTAPPSSPPSSDLSNSDGKDTPRSPRTPSRDASRPIPRRAPSSIETR